MHTNDLNERLLDAARDSSGNGGSGHGGGDIVRILNNIGPCLVETLNYHVGSRRKAIIFVLTPDYHYPIPEDDMITDIRPDWYAYMTTCDVLRASFRDTVAPLPSSCYSIICIGEQVSGGSNADGKIMRYLQIFSQYRYDLRTVYGFQYDHRSHRGKHWSFNACGWAHSDWLESNPEPTTNPGSKRGKRKAEVQEDPLLPWVQHVLFLYSSDHSRIGHITRGDHIRVNLWTVYGKTFVVVPFHTSPGPGRMTVVFLILSNRKANTIIGILKRQWQDKNGRFIEGDLIAFAQSIWRFPCFPMLNYIGPTETCEISQRSNPGIERQLSLLKMKTLGYPLTSCEDSMELLMVAFDAILAHWLLYKKCGILHRDISWNNVLCKPEHLLAEDELKKKQEQAFRKPIMEVLGLSKGKWCTLLTDLDQAVKYDEWKSDDHQKRLERTGTPMFIAIEKSSITKEPIPERNYTDLQKLSMRLSEAELLRPATFEVAFPFLDENTAFNSNWNAVLQKEWDRTEGAKKFIFPEEDELDPMHDHQAFHDVESFFWVFLWAFARARPADSDSAPSGHYNDFCDVMLHHKIENTDIKVDRRFSYLYNARTFLRNIFHPKLKRFSELFTSMAEYLSISWSRHAELNLPDDHAHLAMLRLLLGAILREKQEKDGPTKLAKKARYHESTFPTKEIRSNSKSKSRSQSIPLTQAVNLGPVAETEGVQSPLSNPINVGVESVGGDSGDTSSPPQQEIILEPLLHDPQAFLNNHETSEQWLTKGLQDKDITKTSTPRRQPSNSAGHTVDDENPFVHSNVPGLGNKRQAGSADEGNNRGERPSKKTKSAE